MNWVGFETLLWKEIKRFLKVFGQTVISPVVTTLLYLIVFGLSLGNRLPTQEGVGYVDFLVPGLVMLIIINNAFMNTTSSLFISKLQGTLVDLLVAPISNGAVLVAYVLAAVLRSLVCGGAVVLVAWLVSGVGMQFPLQVLGYAVLVAVAFALLGIGTAIVSDKFEQLNVAPEDVQSLGDIVKLRYFAGLTLEQAAQMASLNAARILEWKYRRGILAVGKDADLVALTADLQVRHTIKAGHVVYDAEDDP